MRRSSQALSVAVLLFASLASGADATDAVAWRKSVDAAKIEAAQSNRLILLHFYTKTCGPCRVLDQEVFSLPQVAAAIEVDYVPVKIDADASPAIASAYRIDRVPTDVLLTPQGNILNVQGCPSTGENYVGQLSAIARHFKQTTLADGQSTPPANVNAAYANLPVAAAASTSSTTVAPSVAQARERQAAAMQRAAGNHRPTPQAQTNPYVAASPQNAAAPPVTNAAAAPALAQTTMQPPVAQPGAPAVPAMPANAMPNSYGGYAAGQPTSTAAAASGAAIAAGALQQGVLNAAAGPPQPPLGSGGVQPPATYPVVQVQAPPAQPTQPTIPDGSPPLAFDGCCPVTLKTLKRWTVGNPAYGAIHRGRTYLFVGGAERDQFLADPDGYSPVFSGMDPVKLLDEQKLTPGSRKYGFEVGGRFYLFSSAETMEKFRANFPAYTASVRQAMNRLDAGDVIRR